MKPLNSKSNANLMVLNLAFCCLIALFYSCGSGGGGDSAAAFGKGSVGFSLALDNPAAARAVSFRAAADAEVQFACEDYQIATIEAQVVDKNGAVLVEGSWACDEHQATISGITPGDGIVVKVFGRDADGVVLFEGQSDELIVVAGQTTDAGLIILEPVPFLDTVARVSVDSNAQEGNNASLFPSVSGSGRLVAYGSFADNLATGDSNERADVFVHDLISGITELVSVASDGTQGNDDSGLYRGEGISASIAIGSNGRFVAFASNASNLVSGDSNGSADVFVRDRQLET
ncbi:MAG: hypothetical protein WB819_14450, partial [Terriglobia bacterium]